MESSDIITIITLRYQVVRLVGLAVVRPLCLNHVISYQRVNELPVLVARNDDDKYHRGGIRTHGYSRCRDLNTSQLVSVPAAH